MKSRLLNVLNSVILIVLGWMVYPNMISSFLEPFDGLQVQITSTKVTSQLVQRIMFSFAWGLIPLLLWISKKIFDYKTEVYQIAGYIFMIGSGILSLELRSRHLAYFYENFRISESIKTTVSLESFWVYQFLLLGIFVGLLVYLGAGVLFKQLSRKPKKQ